MSTTLFYINTEKKYDKHKSGSQLVFVCISLFVLSSCSRFGQSNSLPTTGCVGGSVSARRSLRQFQMPSRSLPGARLNLLGSGGLLGPTPRSSSSTPTGPKQGRQVSQTRLSPNWKERYE